jgi:hypothetical protein
MSGVVSLESRVEELCGDLTAIRAPRGRELNARSWQSDGKMVLLVKIV